MLNINRNYIADKFSIPKTNTLVILNGVYQPQLSNFVTNLTCKKEVLKIPKNSRIDNPIHLLFLTSQDCDVTFNLIVEENSYITFIEEYASLGEKPYINNIEISVTAKFGSEISHHKLQFENAKQSNHQSILNISQAENSKVTSSFINKGAEILKDRLHIRFIGEQASINIKGINLLHNEQNMDQQIYIEHLKPNCISNVLFKSVVDDRAINDFNCRVVVYSGASKTETHTTNKNLLLSGSAIVNAAPELEVYNDDVICTHGATVGQIDQEALFYLRSRGIIENMAIKMLILGFVQEITNQFSKYDRYKEMVGLIYE